MSREKLKLYVYILKIQPLCQTCVHLINTNEIKVSLKVNAQVITHKTQAKTLKKLLKKYSQKSDILFDQNVYVLIT